MTVEPGPRAAPPPSPKAPAPELSARAPRPPVIRLRRSAALIAAGAAIALIAGALIWAFVAQPALRAAARGRTAQVAAEAPRGPARPTELITGHPASYDRLAAVPPPAPGGAPGKTSGKAPERAGPGPRPTSAPARAHAGSGPAALARTSGLFFTAAEPRPPRPETPAPAPPAAPAAGSGDLAAVYGGHTLLAPRSPYELKAGAVIPAVLLTAIDTARPGPIVAVVSEPLYDTVTGRQLLLPQGTRLLGRHDGASRHGDRRAFLTWDRLLLPNGKSLVLAGEPGVDARGAVGLEGRTDRRLGPLAIASLFAGAITTLGQAARDGDHSGGLLGDAGDAAAIEAARVGGRLIDRELDVAPSIRLDAGARVRVLLTRDLILEPYAP